MEWRRIPDFPDYEISEYGDVRRVTASATRHAFHRLRGGMSTDGYIEYTLISPSSEKVRHILCHVLVCRVFNGDPPSEKHEVAHKNGSRIANHYTNLCWKTRKENHSIYKSTGRH